MKNLITVSLLLLSIPVIAQKQFIGLKGGPSWTNTFAEDFSVNNDSRIGFTGGLTYEYKFLNNFNLELDFLYAQKGFKNEVVFTDNLGQPTGVVLTSHFDYDYLSLPIKGSFTFGEKLDGFVNIGIVPSFLMKATNRTPGFIIGGLSESYEVTDNVNRFDFGGIAEIGGSYTIKEQFKLFLMFAYQQSFTSITNENYFSYAEIRHFGMIVSFGFKYAIGE